MPIRVSPPDGVSVGAVVVVAYVAAVAVLRISEGRDLYHMVADRIIKRG